MTRPPKSEPVAVEVRAVTDPAGRPAILIQFSQGWLTVRPSEAKHLARVIREVAEEVEQAERE